MAGRPRGATASPRPRAGPAQLGLLRGRASAACYVIAVDRDPGAVGFAFADGRAVVSTEDEEGIDRLARAERVDGGDRLAGHRLAGRGSRRASPSGSACRTRSTPRTARARDVEDQAARARSPRPGSRTRRRVDPRDAALAFPCVVKAPDRQGQRGLALVRDAAGLAAAVDGGARGVALRQRPRRGATSTGPEVTVNAFSLDGASTHSPSRTA